MHGKFAEIIGMTGTYYMYSNLVSSPPDNKAFLNLKKISFYLLVFGTQQNKFELKLVF